MTPDALGYFPCCRCGVLRPLAEMRSDDGEKTGTPIYVCADEAVCSRLAGVGKGALDADTGGAL